MKNIYTIKDYQKAIDFILSLGKSNNELVDLVLMVGRVFKKDNKNFKQGRFEECIWNREEY